MPNLFCVLFNGTVWWEFSAFCSLEHSHFRPTLFIPVSFFYSLLSSLVCCLGSSGICLIIICLGVNQWLKITIRLAIRICIENLIVLDGTTGQNALSQAREFGEVADLTGIILTKMDGTAKGGIAVAIQSELNVPVKYIGVGETIEDLQKFDVDEFVNALFDIKPEEEAEEA